MWPLISVIVPVYNVEGYLHKCIKSLLEQSYNNLEIILVDDGSTDASGAICDSYSKDSRIKVIHKEHEGVADARNRGLAAVNGSYIGFLDGDDYLDLDFYTYLYRALLENSADISQCAFKKVLPNEEIASSQTSAELSPTECISGYYMLQNLRTSKYYPANTILGNKLYRRDLFIGLQFRTGRLHEDEYIIHQIYYKATRVCINTKVLYYYVQRPSSIMGIRKQERFDDIMGVYKDRLEFFDLAGDESLQYQVLKHELLTLLDFYLNYNDDRAYVMLINKKHVFTCVPTLAAKYKLLLNIAIRSRFFGKIFLDLSRHVKYLKNVTFKRLR